MYYNGNDDNDDNYDNDDGIGDDSGSDNDNDNSGTLDKYTLVDLSRPSCLSALNYSYSYSYSLLPTILLLTTTTTTSTTATSTTATTSIPTAYYIVYHQFTYIIIISLQRKRYLFPTTSSHQGFLLDLIHHMVKKEAKG